MESSVRSGKYSSSSQRKQALSLNNKIMYRGCRKVTSLFSTWTKSAEMCLVTEKAMASGGKTPWCFDILPYDSAKNIDGVLWREPSEIGENGNEGVKLIKQLTDSWRADVDICKLSIVVLHSLHNWIGLHGFSTIRKQTLKLKLARTEQF